LRIKEQEAPLTVLVHDDNDDKKEVQFFSLKKSVQLLTEFHTGPLFTSICIKSAIHNTNVDQFIHGYMFRLCEPTGMYHLQIKIIEASQSYIDRFENLKQFCNLCQI
jgi:hypothetical protein